MTNSDVLTVKEAAAYLQIDPRRLYELVKEGQISARRVGHQWRFSRAALEKYVRTQTDKQKG